MLCCAYFLSLVFLLVTVSLLQLVLPAVTATVFLCDSVLIVSPDVDR